MLDNNRIKINNIIFHNNNSSNQFNNKQINITLTINFKIILIRRSEYYKYYINYLIYLYSLNILKRLYGQKKNPSQFLLIILLI